MTHKIHDAVGLALCGAWLKGCRRIPSGSRWPRRISHGGRRRMRMPLRLLAAYREWIAILQRPVADVCGILSTKAMRGSGCGRIRHSPGCFRRRRSGGSSGRFMQRSQLEQYLCAAAAITGTNRFVLIGSQAILGQFPRMAAC